MNALLRAAREALAELDPAARVAASLPRLRGSVTIVAIGKAAPAMAEGALGKAPQARVVVVAPDGTDPRGRKDVLRAGHPIPDARSVRAAEACLEAARREEGTLVVLVSGGASALVCAPAPGITLADKRAVTRAMLRSGASIQDVNVVRKHLSRIKGGGLARVTRARVLTRIVSDVIGGRPSDIGSGPSVADPSGVKDARALLRRFAPAHASLPLVRTLASGPPTRSARIVASPEELAQVVAAHLDLTTRVLPPSQGSVEALADEYLRLARRLRPGHAVVRAAEPSLVVPRSARGRGGRATHLAALVARDLPPGVRFLALATDGVDGTSGTAGALVTRRLDVVAALAAFDTGPLHRAAGTAIPEGPAGHNLTDLHVLARAR